MAQLGALAVEDLERLLQIRERVGLDLVRGEHRAGRVAAARVADPRRVVADDQHHRVAGVLKGAQLGQHHAVPEVDVRAGRVDAQLQPQRTARGELLGEPPFGQRVDRAAQQLLGRLAARWRLAGRDVIWPMLDSPPG